MELEDNDIWEQAKEEYREKAKKVKHDLQRNQTEWADNIANKAETATRKVTCEIFLMQPKRYVGTNKDLWTL